MRKLTNFMLIALIALGLTNVTALAKGKSGRVTFPEEYEVNGTLIKKGTYKVEYDDQAGQLTIFLDKSTAVKTAARLEKRGSKARGTRLSWVKKDNNRVLQSITFGGDRETVVISDGSAQTETAQ
jgi:hypothetical protein